MTTVSTVAYLGDGPSDLVTAAALGGSAIVLVLMVLADLTKKRAAGRG